MYTVRQEKDKTRWAVGEYNSEAGMIVKYKSEYLAVKNTLQLYSTWDAWLFDNLPKFQNMMFLLKQELL